MSVRINIRDIRIEKGISQAELARMACVDKTQLCKLERRGDPRASTLLRIAQALDVSIADLVATDRAGDHDDHGEVISDSAG